MAAQSYRFHHRGFPRFGKVLDILHDVNVEMIPLHYHWGCRTFQTGSHIHAIHILGVWTPYTVMDGMGIWQHTHTVTTTEDSPDLGEFTEILDDVNVRTIPLRYRWGCIPLLCHTYIRCLNTLNSCGWAYSSTIIPLPPQRFPQIWESSLKSYMM
jgi:hypothetical protein